MHRQGSGHTDSCLWSFVPYLLHLLRGKPKTTTTLTTTRRAILCILTLNKRLTLTQTVLFGWVLSQERLGLGTFWATGFVLTMGRQTGGPMIPLIILIGNWVHSSLLRSSDAVPDCQVHQEPNLPRLLGLL